MAPSATEDLWKTSRKHQETIKSLDSRLFFSHIRRVLLIDRQSPPHRKPAFSRRIHRNSSPCSRQTTCRFRTQRVGGGNRRYTICVRASPRGTIVPGRIRSDETNPYAAASLGRVTRNRDTDWPNASEARAQRSSASAGSGGPAASGTGFTAPTATRSNPFHAQRGMVVGSPNTYTFKLAEDHSTPFSEGDQLAQILTRPCPDRVPNVFVS